MIIFIFATINIYALDCNDPNKIISYSPNDLQVGMPFNLSFIDFFNQNGEIYLYLPPALNIITGENPANLLPDGYGGGYYSWILNSTSGGKYNISVEVRYQSPWCNVTREIDIKPYEGKPNLIINFFLPEYFIAEKQNLIKLNIKNIGNGRAYNINGLTYLDNFNNLIDNFNVQSLSSNNEINRSIYLINKYCASHSLINIMNYKDNVGNNYINQINKDIELKGAKLYIIFARFYLGNKELKNGDRVNEDSLITLKANLTNKGNYYGNNSKIFIYEDGKLRKTIDVGNININEEKYVETNFRLTETDNVELKIVFDSETDCENNPYSTIYAINIKVTSQEVPVPPGGGGGGGETNETNRTYICGNGVCEINLGENQVNCPQDCKIVYQPITQPKQEYAEILSDDGLVRLRINVRTVITNKEGKRVGLNEINITRIKDITLIPPISQNVYLVRAYKISPEVNFDLPAEIIFSYGDEILKDANLFIYKYIGDWQELKTNWDKQNKKISAQIYSTSIFGLFTDKIYQPPMTGAFVGVINWLKERLLIPLILFLFVILILVICFILTKRKKRKSK